MHNLEVVFLPSGVRFPELTMGIKLQQTRQTVWSRGEDTKSRDQGLSPDSNA